jgi:hypothetical protein
MYIEELISFKIKRVGHPNGSTRIGKRRVAAAKRPSDKAGGGSQRRCVDSYRRWWQRLQSQGSKLDMQSMNDLAIEHQRLQAESKALITAQIPK